MIIGVRKQTKIFTFLITQWIKSTCFSEQKLGVAEDGDEEEEDKDGGCGEGGGPKEEEGPREGKGMKEWPGSTLDPLSTSNHPSFLYLHQKKQQWLIKNL